MSEGVWEGRSYLYWAVVEHIRTWLGEDGPLILAVRENRGRLDGAMLRRIASAYNVNRGIKARPQKSKFDKHADNLSKLLNDARPWPAGLVKRAEKCCKIASKAKNRQTNGLQASAITKFSWFAQPKNWTVYDRFVASALDIKNGDTGERMLHFYDKLNRLGFLELADAIQVILDDKGLMDLHGTRVLDKLLMLEGARRRQEPDWATKNILMQCRGFLELLPRNWERRIESLVGQIDRQIDASRLLK